MSLPEELFPSWPNPLLPILRPHSFSQCLRQSIQLWPDVRIQVPRFQRPRTTTYSKGCRPLNFFQEYVKPVYFIFPQRFSITVPSQLACQS
jgi:hypothetical protein